MNETKYKHCLDQPLIEFIVLFKERKNLDCTFLSNLQVVELCHTNIHEDFTNT